ncbi:ankyrin [Byssothecium circinans]|uniref:Ankyrin n=1 Tax=Byssothecium circinans TaxID=147558 RepID=A0A6A5UDR0_9PLEO|nr:ankyrin [Byssothecium circinans]
MARSQLRRSMVRTMPLSHLYALVLLVILPHAVAADGDSPSEFAFTLFTDFAPLLALFGEQFARQFMSESLTWLDHIIFAMAPLGILTAIVGAIRVSGPGWAKAFIGRARETRAAAEIELMSSTSSEVCEVYNGKNVVRAMGTPKLTQFILFPPEYRDDDRTCGIHTLETAYNRKQPFLEKGEYGVMTDWDTPPQQVNGEVMGTGIVLGTGLALGVGADIRVHLKKVSDNAKKSSTRKDKQSVLSTSPDGTIGPRRRRLWSRSKSKPPDVEDPLVDNERRAKEKQIDEHSIDAKGTKSIHRHTFPEELKGSSPNLQLNLPSNLSSHKGTIGELWCAAALAIFLQLSVMVVSAVTSFHPRIQQSIGRPQMNFGFWLFIAGTLCLNLGMILCSFVIEQSTREWAWRKTTRGLQLLGPEKEGDLSIDSVENSSEEAQSKSPVLTKTKTIAQGQRSSSKEHSNDANRADPSKELPPLQLFWMQQKHSVNDQDFDPFLILGGHKDEILTSSRLKHEPWKTIWGMTIPTWATRFAGNQYEFLTICASVLGVVGFILQLEGLRGLAWPTALSQLGAIFLVALLRAIIRRRLGESPTTISTFAGHELDWLTLRLVYERNALPAPHASGDADVVKAVTRWKVLTRPDLPNVCKNEDKKSPSDHPNAPRMRSNIHDISQFPRSLLMERGEMVDVQKSAYLLQQRILRKPEQDSEYLFQQTSQVAVDVRRRLGELAQCPGVASQEAIALAQAISLVLTDLCPVQEDGDKTFTWSLATVMLEVDEEIEARQLNRPKPSRTNSNKLLPAIPKREKSGDSQENTPHGILGSKPDTVTLKAKGNKKGWNMRPVDIDAILSLWMSTIARSGANANIKDRAHGKGGTKDDDMEDDESGNWLSQASSATVKYRRILGENPPRYKPQDPTETLNESDTGTDTDKRASIVRTDILTRDLNWWTSDPRVTAITENTGDPQDTGDDMLEIGFNGLYPKRQTVPNSDTRKSQGPTTKKSQAPEASKISAELKAVQDEAIRGKVVSIISDASLEVVLAHHLFSAFMWAVSDEIQEDKIDTATVEDAELFDGSDFQNTWNIPTLRNKRLMKLARAIVGLGLGPIDDVLLAIIPPLSHRGILPNEAMMGVLLRKTKDHERDHDWPQAQTTYLNLLDLQMDPRGMDRISYEIVVELIEFLFLARETIDDLRGSMTLEGSEMVGNQATSLRQAVKAVSSGLQAHELLFRVASQLHWFYYRQQRNTKFDNLMKSLQVLPSEVKIPSDRNQSKKVTRPDDKLLKLVRFSPYHEYIARCLAEKSVRSSDESTRQEMKSESKQTATTKESEWKQLATKPDIFGWYPLHYATVGGNSELFQDVSNIYINMGKPQHELRDKSGRTPLHYAAMYQPGWIKTFTGTQEKGKSAAKVLGKNGMLPIHCAARSGEVKSLENLEKYCNLNAVDSFGRSALHLAVLAVSPEAVEFLLKDDTRNPILQTGDELLQRTPLHFALVSAGDKYDPPELVDKKKVIVNQLMARVMAREKDLEAMTITDERKDTPIKLALRNQDVELFKTLLSKLPKVPRPQGTDAERSVATICFTSMLKEAVRLKSQDVLVLLFEHVKNEGWDARWIADAFSEARDCSFDDMLHRMLKIVDSLVGETVSGHTASAGATEATGESDEPMTESQADAKPYDWDAALKVTPKFRNDLEREFQIRKELVMITAVQSMDPSFVGHVFDKGIEDLGQEHVWNKKDSQKRSALAYIAKLKKVRKGLSDEELDIPMDRRIAMLDFLWGCWRVEDKARALNDPQGKFDKTPLIYAVRNNLLPLAKKFVAAIVEAKAHIEGMDWYGSSAFMYALQKADDTAGEWRKTLADADPSLVNEITGTSKTGFRTTPLIEAVRDGRSDITEFLSTYPETDPNLGDRDGDPTLTWAYWQESPDLLLTLFGKFKTIDPHKRNKSGISPLMYAYRDAMDGGISPRIQNMFKAPRIRMQGYEVTLMLSHANCRGNIDLVNFLLKKRADPCSSDDAGRSQVELAALRGNVEVFKFLCQTLEVAKQTQMLKRVYHACVQRTHEHGRNDEIIDELIKRKIDISTTELDANGWNLEDCAMYAGNPQALTKLNIKGETSPSPLRQHRPPSSWALRPDNPFFEARPDECILMVKAPFPNGLPSAKNNGSQFLVRADSCIPYEMTRYYWEMEIIHNPADITISMGICSPHSESHGHVGWTGSASCGYHSDDGSVFDNRVADEGYTGPPWSAGHVVGCLIVLRDTYRAIEFFMDGSSIGFALKLPDNMRGQLYPCVAMRADQDSEGTKVKATFGAELKHAQVTSDGNVRSGTAALKESTEPVWLATDSKDVEDGYRGFSIGQIPSAGNISGATRQVGNEPTAQSEGNVGDEVGRQS